MSLTEKLIALRKKKGFTQATLAEKMDISRQSISRWKIGDALPSTDNLRRLSELFGVPVDYLMNDDAPELGAAVAVMEEPEKRGRKLTAVGAVIGFVIALLIALIAGVFLSGYEKGVEDTIPTYSVDTVVLTEEDFEEPGSIIGW